MQAANLASLSSGKRIFFYFGVLIGTGGSCLWIASWPLDKIWTTLWALLDFALVLFGWALPVLMTKREISVRWISAIPTILLISTVAKFFLGFLSAAA